MNRNVYRQSAREYTPEEFEKMQNQKYLEEPASRNTINKLHEKIKEYNLGINSKLDQIISLVEKKNNVEEISIGGLKKSAKKNRKHNSRKKRRVTTRRR
jgi:hypothetical protein